jgi:hypothetical protein
MPGKSPLPPASDTLAAAAACRIAVASGAPSPPTPPSDLPVRTPARSLLGPRPLIAGEDGADYDDILQRISADAMPGDFIEEIWVRNVGDLVWESIRLRRLKAQLMQAAMYQGLEAVLSPLVDDAGDADALARTWAGGDEEAIAEVERLLGRAGLTIDAVMAQTLAVRIDDIARIDGMITVAEERRDTVLREIVYHRAGFGRALCRAGQSAMAAVDAEFETVPSIAVAPRDAP